MHNEKVSQTWQAPEDHRSYFDAVKAWVKCVHDKVGLTPQLCIDAMLPNFMGVIGGPDPDFVIGGIATLWLDPDTRWVGEIMRRHLCDWEHAAQLNELIQMLKNEEDEYDD